MQAPTIEAVHLTKRYGNVAVVDDLSFTIGPGQVIGLLGPQGAGKSTTMRLLLGRDRPTCGVALVNGHPYTRADAPIREVGALPEPDAVHRSRTVRAHLRWLAWADSLPGNRVDEVLDPLGLTGVGGQLIGELAPGMRRRLDIACALLGDPAVLILDEPLDGLDPDGVVRVRRLLRDLAAQGRTVLVSGHRMRELAATTDHVLVMGDGLLVDDFAAEQLTV